MEAIRDSAKREDALGTLADNLVPKASLAEKEHPICADMTVSMSQGTSRGAIARNNVFIEDAVNDLIIREGHNEVRKTDRRLLNMRQAVVNKTLDKNIYSVEFKSPLLCEV